MQLISIENAREGQVLARDVVNQSGTMLCPVGFILNERIVERLRCAGIESIVVEGGESQGPSREERLRMLGDRFTGIDDPIMLQLRAIMEKRLGLRGLQ